MAFSQKGSFVKVADKTFILEDNVIGTMKDETELI
jgi:hypothetical protein